MNVASLELCKELYELSGWDAIREWYLEDETMPKRLSDLNMEHWTKIAPAYDLGYLLRKLQEKIDEHSLVLYRTNDGWIGSYEGFVGGALSSTHSMFANTPEDAACKLAIELFKQGVLK